MIDEQKCTAKEYKEKSKNLQQSLAMKIVKLEETLDLVHEQNELQLNSTEDAYRQEIDDIKRGVASRESRLLD